MRPESTTSSPARLYPPTRRADARGPRRAGGPEDAASAKQQDGRGPTGNSRLTATNGVLLLVLVAIEGLTLVSLRPLLPAHVFVGMLLIPPIALKLGSTGYRFARYYTGDEAYVLAGPPQLLMRALGPFVIAATLALFGSGSPCSPSGQPGLDREPAQGELRRLAHRTGVHVLGHILHVPGLAAADFRAPRERRSGSWLRQAAVAAALVAGLVLAIATLQYAAPWQAVIGSG